MDESALKGIAVAWTLLAVGTYFLLRYVTAPFGRHTSSSWGPTMNNKLGWFIMEVPSLVIMLIALMKWFQSDRQSYSWLPIALWITHYTNRSIIYPLRIKSTPKPMPVIVAALAILFNLVNAGLNATYLITYGDMYSTVWLKEPTTILGLTIFITGFTTNCYADSKLIALRSEGKSGYSIPRGFLFDWVSCPNLMGECLEWTGFAVMTSNLTAVTFMVWTWANLVPRAASHHAWYEKEFKDYPRNRRIILPWIY
ncbi:hypothetical protein LEN26_012386 [Aphanomyces euteiches]|nr:hypothetical protein LEN26_012386 [Aphanomyces euteiches]KAH9129322.1 hypothetical protein AeMF1_000608 [Aphanomyces euteiches]